MSSESIQDLVVIDNGAYTIKFGTADQSSPKIVPNCIMKARSEKKRFFIGDRIDDCRDLSGLYYQRPSEHGHVIRWDLQKNIWDHVVKPTLGEDSTVVMTQPLCTFRDQQEAVDEIFFEEYEVRRLCCAHPTDFAMRKFSKKNETMTGVIIDSGFSYTHIVPYINGKIYTRKVYRIDVGGKALTNYLKEIISYRQLNVMEETYVINQLKEDTCYASLNFKADMQKAMKPSPENDICVNYVLPDFNHYRRGVLIDPSEANKGAFASAQHLRMNNERFTVSELLLAPKSIGIEQMGIAEALVDCIKSLPKQDAGRVSQHVYLCGGNALIPHLRDRIEREARSYLSTEMRLRVHCPEKPLESPWLGAVKYYTDAFAEFEKSCVTKAEYEEHGSNYCFKKFYSGNDKYAIVPDETPANKPLQPSSKRKYDDDDCPMLKDEDDAKPMTAIATLTPLLADLSDSTPAAAHPSTTVKSLSAAVSPLPTEPSTLIAPANKDDAGKCVSKLRDTRPNLERLPSVADAGKDTPQLAQSSTGSGKFTGDDAQKTVVGEADEDTTVTIDFVPPVGVEEVISSASGNATLDWSSNVDAATVGTPTAPVSVLRKIPQIPIPKPGVVAAMKIPVVVRKTTAPPIAVSRTGGSTQPPPAKRAKPTTTALAKVTTIATTVSAQKQVAAASSCKTSATASLPIGVIQGSSPTVVSVVKLPSTASPVAKPPQRTRSVLLPASQRISDASQPQQMQQKKPSRQPQQVQQPPVHKMEVVTDEAQKRKLMLQRQQVNLHIKQVQMQKQREQQLLKQQQREKQSRSAAAAGHKATAHANPVQLKAVSAAAVTAVKPGKPIVLRAITAVTTPGVGIGAGAGAGVITLTTTAAGKMKTTSSIAVTSGAQPLYAKVSMPKGAPTPTRIVIPKNTIQNSVPGDKLTVGNLTLTLPGHNGKVPILNPTIKFLRKKQVVRTNPILPTTPASQHQQTQLLTVSQAGSGATVTSPVVHGATVIRLDMSGNKK